MAITAAMNFQRFDGSKGGAGVWQRIISQMPPHTTYIEAFLGSGVIMRRKRPAAVSIGIDRNPEVIKLWDPRAVAGVAVLHAENGLYRSTPGLHAICGDARDFLRRYRWTGGELLYCDPPYLFETRSSQQNLYDFEFSDGDHLDLLGLLRKLPCLVMISGYWSALYDRELPGWRAVQIPTVKRSGERAIEWLWCNFPEPVQLHDYRFVGDNWRDRQRIAKKKKRWLKKLSTMPAKDRACLFAAMSELATPEAALLPAQ